MLLRLSLTWQPCWCYFDHLIILHNGTLRQIYWHWPKRGFVISEAQYWCFPLASAGIWQYNHFPIYSFCNVMRCVTPGPHRAELWLNNTANVPRKPELLHTPDAYSGLRNWNPRVSSLSLSTLALLLGKPAHPWERSLDKTAEGIDLQRHAQLTSVHFHLSRFSSCPAALQKLRQGSRVGDTGGLLNWE